jgi:hypothetical protein
MENEELVPAEAAEEIQEETPAGTNEEPEGEQGEEEVALVEGEEQTPRKKTAQERIDEITKARREAEREKEYWRKIALEKQTAPQADPPKPQTSPIPERPRQDQFETYEGYEDALLGWHDNVKEIKNRAKVQQSRLQEVFNTFAKRSDALRKMYDDYDEVIETPPLTEIAKFTIANSEHGPELAYFLGKNHDVANRIAALPVEMQPYELGKLETKLVMAKGTKKVSGAPPPIKPVGMSGGTNNIDESKLEDAEWFARRKAKRIEALKKQSGG